jgi:hypothetical protein
MRNFFERLRKSKAEIPEFKEDPAMEELVEKIADLYAKRNALIHDGVAVQPGEPAWTDATLEQEYKEVNGEIEQFEADDEAIGKLKKYLAVYIHDPTISVLSVPAHRWTMIQVLRKMDEKK